MSMIDRVLQQAKSQLGVHEVGGNNCGPQVKQYLATVSLPEGNPWCAAFVSWCLRAAGVPERPCTGDTWALESWARTHGVLHDSPAAGDVFLLIGSDGHPMHTGFVTSVGGGRVGTIEGNTGGPSDTDGDGVYAKSRPADACRYVRWADAPGDQEAPPAPARLGKVYVDAGALTVIAEVPVPPGTYHGRRAADHWEI